MNHYLVADIGGTNARVGLVTGDGNEVYGIEQFTNQDFPSLEEVIHHYLQKAQCLMPPKKACFAVACPVTGDAIQFTNNSWSFSIEAMKATLGLDSLHVMNDFEAVARSLPFLGPKDLYQIGNGEPRPHRALAVLGPGTGLGMGGLVPGYPSAIPLPSEGGHAAFAAQSELEVFILNHLRAKFGFVCNEDLLSGAGLVNIYEALAARSGRKEAALNDPSAISYQALEAEDPFCQDVLECFCGILGSVAGDFALQLGAEGGVYIAGGIVPRFLPFLEKSSFRRRFEAKGRFSSYVATIPTYVIIGTQPGLIGTASLFDDETG